MSLSTPIIAGFEALERNMKMHAQRAMEGGKAPFSGTILPLDNRILAAEVYHAIGDAFGRAAMDLKAQDAALAEKLEGKT